MAPDDDQNDEVTSPCLENGRIFKRTQSTSSPEQENEFVASFSAKDTRVKLMENDNATSNARGSLGGRPQTTDFSVPQTDTTAAAVWSIKDEPGSPIAVEDREPGRAVTQVDGNVFFILNLIYNMGFIFFQLLRNCVSNPHL